MAVKFSDLPLAITMIGPMAFKQTDAILEVWMPVLDDAHFEHQAGIGTDVSSFVLGNLREYSLLAPNPQTFPGATSAFNPPASNPSVPLAVQPGHLPQSFFVHLTLPRPKSMVSVSSVPCKIHGASLPTATFLNRPTGFRLLYEKAGAPVLTSSEDPRFNFPVPFDPSPDEKQLEMFISYAPFVIETDRGHPEAKSDLAKLGLMVGLDLSLEFEGEFQVRFAQPFTPFNGPLQNCKSVNLMLI
ncbi:MAG TPA: hypothetical protein VNW97_13635 [Candidatus Saccharimonadales bacterium]|jgi:hypothetical protein|nr:hypothetical protein [Candidatus Saccharimonadales bacterium]